MLDACSALDLNLESYLPSNPPPLVLLPLPCTCRNRNPSSTPSLPLSFTSTHSFSTRISFVDKETQLQAICFLLLKLLMSPTLF